MTLINIFSLFSEKTRLDVSSESSARQRIHMKNQALFSSKDKIKKLKCHPLQFLFSALRVNRSLCCTRIYFSSFTASIIASIKIPQQLQDGVFFFF